MKFLFKHVFGAALTVLLVAYFGLLGINIFWGGGLPAVTEDKLICDFDPDSKSGRPCSLEAMSIGVAGNLFGLVRTHPAFFGLAVFGMTSLGFIIGRHFRFFKEKVLFIFFIVSTIVGGAAWYILF